MAYSIFLGEFIGINFIIMSLAFLFNKKLHEKAYNEIAENSTLWILVSGTTFFFGLLIVFTHNIWSMDWRGLVTLVGWILLVSGILRLCFQTKMMQYCKKATMKKLPHRLVWVMLAVGVFLLYASLYTIY